MGTHMSVSANDLKKFAANMKKLSTTQAQQWNEEALSELAQRLLAKVTKRTPVGFYGAMATYVVKRGKNAGQTRIKHVNPSGKQGGTLRRGWTIGAVTREGGGYSIEVINPIEYASYVEFGHRQTPGRYVPQIGKTLKKSWVEGKFMMTISEQELTADAPRILSNKLKKFIEGLNA